MGHVHIHNHHGRWVLFYLFHLSDGCWLVGWLFLFWSVSMQMSIFWETLEAGRGDIMGNVLRLVVMISCGHDFARIFMIPICTYLGA
ncbi:hypothetical protein VTJ04DRAFT_3133 [Mycothermus thermophilus]|uniref:uncharacterized protein n=1 Tax=Humicola insolens TaxID=85995 RepID=UPI0037427C10